MRDIVAAAGKAAGLYTQVELRDIVPGRRSRPGDVTLHNWVNGRTVAVDVTVVSPVVNTVVRSAALKGGAAAAAAEARKDKHALEACRTQNIDFLPLALESFGGYGRRALSFIRQLAHFVAQRSGRTRSEETRYLFQSISVELQRGNAIMVQEMVPAGVHLEDY